MDHNTDFFLDLIDKKLADELEDAFQPDELAYLGMTGKVEKPIRDKLAYLLHEKLKESGSDCYVAREWPAGYYKEERGGWYDPEEGEKPQPRKCAIDIAVINADNDPYCLIELKATNTQNGNTLFGGEPIETAVQQDKIGEISHVKREHLKGRYGLAPDLRRMASYSKCDKFFGIFIGVHPTEIIKDKNPAIEKIYTCPEPVEPETMLKYYNYTVSKFFSETKFDNELLEVEPPITINAGKYFDTPIEIVIHLIYKLG